MRPAASGDGLGCGCRRESGPGAGAPLDSAGEQDAALLVKHIVFMKMTPLCTRGRKRSAPPQDVPGEERTRTRRCRLPWSGSYRRRAGQSGQHAGGRHLHGHRVSVSDKEQMPRPRLLWGGVPSSWLGGLGCCCDSADPPAHPVISLRNTERTQLGKLGPASGHRRQGQTHGAKVRASQAAASGLRPLADPATPQTFILFTDCPQADITAASLILLTRCRQRASVPCGCGGQ